MLWSRVGNDAHTTSSRDVVDHFGGILRIDERLDAISDDVHTAAAFELEAWPNPDLLTGKLPTLRQVSRQASLVEGIGVIRHANELASGREKQVADLSQGQLAIRIRAVDVQRRHDLHAELTSDRRLPRHAGYLTSRASGKTGPSECAVPENRSSRQAPVMDHPT
jgi:hypothetical protein